MGLKEDEVKGFRTMLPSKFLKYKYLEKKFQKVASQFGYFPIETPALESGEILTKKGGLSPEQTKEIFMFQDHGDRWVGMRPDITTPVARIVSSGKFMGDYPLRWSYFTRVWRYEKPQAGRYREFWQHGIESIGNDSVFSDFEVISLLCNQYKELGFKPNNFKLLISHRDILRGLIKSYNVSDEEKITQIIRIIDKKDKISNDELTNEIRKIKDNDKLIKEIDKLFDVDDVFEYISEIKDKDEKIEKAYNRLKKLNTLFEENNLLDFIRYDLSLARGFDYYTGVVFEAIVTDESGNKIGGSIAGGGRYDELVGLFGSRDVPCIGYGIGVDRTIEALIELGNKKIKSIKDSPIAHIIVYLENDDYRKKALKLLDDLRSENINVTLTLDEYDSWGKMFKKEFKFADKHDIKYGIIIDDLAIDKNKFILKNLKKREQVELAKKDLIKKLNEESQTIF
ncbi:MAG: histidine--tRNA ligase [Candidatus Woesearchaeota archaeon]